VKTGLSFLLLVPCVLDAQRSPANYQPRWTPQLTAQVCVERIEDNGILNIRPAYVVLDSNYRILVLTGGEAACASVEPGRHSIRVESPDPYDPASNEKAAWKSQRLSFEVASGRRADFEMCGASGGQQGYSTWVIAPRGTFVTRRKRVANGTSFSYIPACE
jgi:hypothetical protein